MFSCNKDASGDYYGAYGEYIYCVTPLAVRLFLADNVQWDKIASVLMFIDCHSVLTFIDCHKPLVCVELPDSYERNNIESLKVLLANVTGNM